MSKRNQNNNSYEKISISITAKLFSCIMEKNWVLKNQFGIIKES